MKIGVKVSPNKRKTAFLYYDACLEYGFHYSTEDEIQKLICLICQIVMSNNSKKT
jgi:hypothetical protein